MHCFPQFGVICKLDETALPHLNDLPVTGKSVEWEHASVVFSLLLVSRWGMAP